MIIDELFEAPQMCPECGGISFSDLILAEKKDACYYKVKASAKVWPSAYASGRLVQCRKKGSANYGNKSESVAEVYNAITGALLAYDEHEKNKGMAEGLNEDVGGNYLYHATGADGLKGMLSSGSIRSATGPQSATTAQTTLPTVSVTRDWNYASGGAGSSNTSVGHDAILVLDRNAVESNFKTLGTSQSQDVRGQAYTKKQQVSRYNMMSKYKTDDPEQQKDIDTRFRSPKAGGEFEEAVVVPKGSLPLKGTMVGFWVNPKSQLTKDPEVMNDPRRLELAPGGTGRFVKAQQTQGMAEDQLDEKWSDKYKRSINCANPKGFSQKAHCAGRKKNENVAENAGQSLSVQQLATISDEALDNAYHYGRSTPGNTFGWQANLKSAAYAKQMIDQGVTDIEAISDAIHKGWNTTAQAFVQNPDQFDDTAKLAAAGKLEAKLQQRAQLMKQNYAQLPEEEKEKDRVVARALLKAIRGEQGVSETLGKQIHSTFQSMGNSFSDAHLAKGISYFLQGRHQEGENWLRGKIPAEAQAAVFGKLRTLQAQGGVDVNKNANVQQYIDDKLVPWVKNQIQASVKEGEEPKTIWHGGLTISGPGSDAKAQQLDIDHELDEGGDVFMANIQNTPEYKAGFATGKLPVPYPEGTQQYASYYKGVIDKASPTLSKVGEGEQRKGADYRDPREVDYDDEYDAMVARVRKLAGLGPMKTVYDPNKRVYRNMPTAVQPKK